MENIHIKMSCESLKNKSDEEIVILFWQALQYIRTTQTQYGEIKVIISGGKVKFLTIEKPFIPE